MKKIIAVFLLLFTLFCIFLYPRVISLTSDIFLNFLNNIVPSLLPLIFLLNLLIDFNVLEIIMAKGSIIKEITLILISILLGAPANLILLNKLEQNKIISSEKKFLLVSCFGTFSFSYLCYLFIYNSDRRNYILLSIILFCELFVYLIFFKKDEITFKKCSIAITKRNFNNSMFSTLKTLVFLLFTTLLMNLIFIFNPNAYNVVPYLIMPFEFSYAGGFVKVIEFNYKELVLLLITSLSSISIFLQLIYTDRKYDLFGHIKKRTIVVLLSLSLFYIFYF